MRRLAMTAAALAAALTLAGCGSQSSSTTDNNGAGSTPATSAAAAGEHNSADVTFAQMMIPHHEQAIEMAKLAEVRAENPQVKEPASQIQAAQHPEINTMKGWLASWGEPTTAAGMDHGGANGGGMMSSEDMTKLEGLTGSAFDREFLTMMTAHHQGAIEMARTEQADGRYKPATTMAADIVRTQSEEIIKMAELQKPIQ